MKRLTKRQKRYNKKSYAIIREYWEVAKTRAETAFRMTGDGDYLYMSKITYKQFKNRVRRYATAKDVTIREAAKKMSSTEGFLSPAERSRMNFVEGLKDKFPADYNSIRKLSRDARGHFKSVRENLEWNKDLNGYVLGGKYFIDVTNSPEQVVIITL